MDNSEKFSPEESAGGGTGSLSGHILAVEINDFLPSAKASSKGRSRVIPNILHLLDHIDKHRAEGNFFITSPIMKDFPEVVSLVASRGHEIGLCCDFMDYRCSGNLKEFKGEIEQITGQRSYGVMAKGGSENGRLLLKKLAGEGFRYALIDFNPSPGFAWGQPAKIKFDSEEAIMIFPSSRIKFLGMKLPFGLPGRIRLYPYWFLRQCLRSFTRNNMPAVMNFPLWEFDPHLPRKVLSPLQSLKSYGNLSLAEFKLTRLLLEFDFVKITRFIDLENPVAD